MIRFCLLSYKNSRHLSPVFQVLPRSASNIDLLTFNQSLAVSFALLKSTRRALRRA